MSRRGVGWLLIVLLELCPGVKWWRGIVYIRGSSSGLSFRFKLTFLLHMLILS